MISTNDWCYTNLDQILLILDPAPDERGDVDDEDGDHCAEHGHALQELLRREHGVEVYGVGWYHKVTAERGQVSAQTLSLFYGGQRANLEYTKSPYCVYNMNYSIIPELSY